MDKNFLVYQNGFVVNHFVFLLLGSLSKLSSSYDGFGVKTSCLIVCLWELLFGCLQFISLSDVHFCFKWKLEGNL